MCNLVRSGRPDPATYITTTYEREYCTRQVIDNAEAGEPCENYEIRTDWISLRTKNSRIIRKARCIWWRDILAGVQNRSMPMVEPPECGWPAPRSKAGADLWVSWVRRRKPGSSDR